MLEFRTLGTVDLRGDDGQRIESVLLHSKRVALLAYLCASHPPKLHRRDTLLALLWPDSDEEHARGALRQTLTRLRQALGPGVLVGDGREAVAVDPRRLWCDVGAFEEAMASARPWDALELWGGEFLPGVHVHGGEFERWLDEIRDRLVQKVIDAARRSTREAEAANDLSRAVVGARMVTELAPHDESGWRSLIGLLDRAGDRAGSLAAFDTMRARLRSEWGIEPSPETRVMVERIREREEAFTVIAVLPVENHTGDSRLDALAHRLTDRLTRGIAGPQFARVGLGDRVSNATAVVSAALYQHSEAVEVSARISEPGEGGSVVAVAEPVLLEKGHDEAWLDAVVARVVVLVALHYDQRTVATGRAALSRVPSLESYTEYLRGSECFGEFQFARAAEHLRRAYDVDTCHLRAAIFAGIALAYDGRPGEADALVTSALAAGEPLPPYEGGFGRWFLAALHGRRAEAYRAAADMLSLTSHAVFRMIAAWEAMNMNLPRDVLRFMPDVRNLGIGWWHRWSGGWEAYGGAYHAMGDHTGELAAALEGRELYPESFDPVRAEIRARAGLRQSDEVLRLVGTAMTFGPRPAGLPPVPTTPADIAWGAAAELDAHGEPDAAVRAREMALRWLTGRTAPTRAGKLLEARLRLECGDAEGASSLAAALAPFAELESIGLVALAAAACDDYSTAKGALAKLEALRGPYLSGRHLLIAAGIRAALNEADAAVDSLREAFAQGLPFTVDLHALPMFRTLAERQDFAELMHPRG